jgi:hypothetical protein
MKGRPLASLLTVVLGNGILVAQEMQPRAYLPSPRGVGFAGFAYSYNSGGLLFDPSLPITDAQVNAHVMALSLGASLNSFGRSSQALLIMPYAVADLTGKFAGVDQYRYRSGLADLTLRYAINLYGAPSMGLREFAQYKQNLLIGVSLTATTPSGQYDPNVAINIGRNRWDFKPEIGVSKAWGPWAFEGAFGAWLYTKNSSYYGGTERTVEPLWSTQAHVVRVIKRRHWVAYDLTYFAGGKASVNGRPSSVAESNTRMGLTYGWVLSPRQAIRFTYFEGVTTRLGADLRSVGVAYQVVWLRGK